MIRKIATLVAFCLVLAAPAAMAAEWTGWITDEHCGAKGAKAEHQSCALRCADRGAALVFYNLADEKVYKLDDQAAAKKHLGHKVKVTGTMDEATIKVEAIDEVPAE